MKMKLPDGATGFNPNGFVLAVTDGTVDIPDEHVATALSHGLTHHKDVAPEPELLKKDSRVILTLENSGTVSGTIKTIRRDGTIIVAGDDGSEYISPAEHVVAE